MRWRDRQKIKIIVRLIIVGLFLFFSYDYFMKNSIDAFFTRLIQLPLIYQVVQSWVYWVIVLAIGFGIWKLTDYINIG